MTQITFIKYLIIKFIILIAVNNNLTAQVGFKLSSDPSLINGNLSMDGLVLQIHNNSNFNGECVFKIYSDRFQQNEIAVSKTIIINSAIHSFDLNEIFSDAKFPWQDLDIKTVCFQLVTNKQNLPLGISCFEIIPYVKSQKEKLSNEKIEQVKKHLDVNLSYQYESWPAIDNSIDRHILDYNGEVNVKEIPFKFQGYVQSSKDPFFDHSFSNGRVFFDLNEWKENVMKNLRPKLESKLDSLLKDYPAFDLYKSRGAYIEKLLNDPSYLSDIKDLDGLETLASDLGIDTSIPLEKTKEVLEQKLKNEVDKLKNNSSELGGQQLDSLNQIVNDLESKLVEIEKYNVLVSKEKAYENLKSLKSEADAYIGKAETVRKDYESKVDSILSDPSKVNGLLKEHGIGNDLVYLTNHISNFELGTIQPNYSELVLQNSFLRGINLGVDFKKFNVSGFYGKSNSRNRLISADSSFNLNKIIGLKIAYDLNKRQTSSFFFISNLPFQINENYKTTNVIGYNGKAEFTKNQSVSIDFALNEPFKNRQSQTSRFGENAAFALDYKLDSRDSKFSTSIQSAFFGPTYEDIDNPFLINNSIEFNSSISYEVFKGINFGLNSFFQKNEVFENIEQQNRSIFSNGLSISLAKEKLPFVNYVYNFLESDLQDFSITSHLHSLNVAKAFKIQDVSLQIFTHANLINNISNTDSLANSNLNLMTSLEIIWSEKFRTTFTYNKQEFNSYLQKEVQENLILKLPMSFNNVNVSPGFQYIKNADKYECGFSLEALIRIWEDLNVSANANSHSFYSYLDDDLNVNTIYTPEISLRLNYRF